MEKKILLYALICLFLSACGKMASDPSGSSQNTSQEPTPPEEPPPHRTQTCYFNESICIPKIDILSITDHIRDYLYPDPKGLGNPEIESQYRHPDHFLDLRGINLNKKVSANFKAGEYVQEAKGPYAILSMVLVQALQAVRDEWQGQILITSGYRSPGYNSGLSGAAKYSRHTYGDAVDIWSPKGKLSDLQAVCDEKQASFSLAYKTHIHCDWRLHALDSEFYPDAPDILPKRVSARETLGGRLAFYESKRRVDFYVENLLVEDEGELLYEWTVTTPSGKVLTGTEPTLSLKPTRGEYKISVLVGNSVQYEEVFVWSE